MDKFVVAHNFLHDIKKHIDPRAVIAGGFIRDIIFDREPKDVDIWVYSYISKTTLIKINPDYNVTRFIHTRESPAMSQIVSVEYQGMIFDIICLKNPEVLPHERFDFAINQAWYDGYSILTTRAFDMDHDHKTLTYLDTLENLGRLDRIINIRLPKFMDKFPGYIVKGLRQNPDGSWYRPKSLLDDLPIEDRYPPKPVPLVPDAVGVRDYLGGQVAR